MGMEFDSKETAHRDISQALLVLNLVRMECYSCTTSPRNDGAGRLDCDSRRVVGPTKTIRGVYMTQLNRLQRLAALSAIREWSF